MSKAAGIGVGAIGALIFITAIWNIIIFAVEINNKMGGQWMFLGWGIGGIIISLTLFVCAIGMWREKNEIS